MPTISPRPMAGALPLQGNGLHPSTSAPTLTDGMKSSEKRPGQLSSSAVSAKRQLPVAAHSSVPSSQKAPNKTELELPSCLKKLVRSIVRTFYSREHSLIVDMLVRNTIMKEDDLCERLRFEKKQLRQYLHTLKTDQFIKSKLQLETDVEGKTTKIIHYFIDYKLFVNVVKYRLDQMQRRLEAEQRQSTSRASFKCPSCNMMYTDLEVDRLLDMNNPGKLICVYCRSEVTEEEDNASRTDARALIAKFHHQVRDPIDTMLRECDEIHLSSSLLEPEFRQLEPLNEDLQSSTNPASYDTNRELDNHSADTKRNATQFGPTENKVRIVLSGQANETTANAKPCPVWMADSTINSGPSAGLGDLDRGSGSSFSSTPSHSTDNPPTNPGSSIQPGSDTVTQTLTPGRVPTNFSSSSNAGSASKDGTGEAAALGPISGGGSGASSSGDLMQLLLVHERRGPVSHGTTKSFHFTGKGAPGKPQPSSGNADSNREAPPQSPGNDVFLVKIGNKSYPYAEVTPAMIKTMAPEERAEYVRIGKQIYMGVMLD
ncbi:unnamed protein product [Calicophoron daubneyi]|uniref:HTH TFE/IIEalpha-type domain-containing protein n=1 Tax=Calicophoron daubneyi TaxID=300641 RepID=A0AAV2T480_CALDB